MTGWSDVSIRARQLRRANQDLEGKYDQEIEFQSAPANYGGRIVTSLPVLSL